MIRYSILGLLLALCICAAGGCTIQRPVDAIRTSGDRHFDRGEYSEAAAEYQLIVNRYPGDWRAQYRLGLSLLELNDPGAARRALEIAHTQRPNDEEIADALAESLFQLDEDEQLYGFLRDRIAATQSVYAHQRLARYALEMGDPDSARVAIITAIELDDGQTVEPYLDAARIAERIGDINEAIRRLSQAYGIDPRDDRVHERLRALGEVPGPTIAMPPGR